MKIVKLSLIVSICLFCLFTLYLGFVFFIASGFIFAGDIDLTDEQRKIAEFRAGIASFFGLILMLLSVFAMFASEVISKQIIKLFGWSFDK